jgi:hypothetical protein
MKDSDTITISKVGQSTLPKWWPNSSGLSQGGVVDVRPMRNGKKSIVLTPRPARRLGAVGLLKLLASCPSPMSALERHALPFK